MYKYIVVILTAFQNVDRLMKDLEINSMYQLTSAGCAVNKFTSCSSTAPCPTPCITCVVTGTLIEPEPEPGCHGQSVKHDFSGDVI